jgi:hypothetical protein
MSLPRVRFTVRGMMIAVAVVALGLLVERFLFDVAVWVVTTHTGVTDD